MSLSDKLKQAASGGVVAGMSTSVDLTADATVTNEVTDITGAEAEEPVVTGEDFADPPPAEGTIAGALAAFQGKLTNLVEFIPKPGDYKVVRLPQVVTAKGDRYLPNVFGYFEKPENQEVQALLDYYASLGYVILVTE